jgi:GNAT superfamily N-acetyltransferase
MSDRSQPEIVRLTVDDWPAYRELRLQALADAPWAFGSTLAREKAFSEEDFRVRLSQRAQWAAKVDGSFVGTVGGMLIDEGDGPHLISMWVHPDGRGQGIGGLLVRAVLDWARDSGHERVRLWVTEGNKPAERLYAKNGFVRTGESQLARADDPSRLEVAMVCVLVEL